MKCYCLNCKGEKEMIVTDEVLINRLKEKKIKGHCKICNEKMCLIEIL